MIDDTQTIADWNRDGELTVRNLENPRAWIKCDRSAEDIKKPQ